MWLKLSDIRRNGSTNCPPASSVRNSSAMSRRAAERRSGEALGVGAGLPVLRREAVALEPGERPPFREVEAEVDEQAVDAGERDAPAVGERLVRVEREDDREDRFAVDAEELLGELDRRRP